MHCKKSNLLNIKSNRQVIKLLENQQYFPKYKNDNTIQGGNFKFCIRVAARMINVCSQLRSRLEALIEAEGYFFKQG